MSTAPNPPTSVAPQKVTPCVADSNTNQPQAPAKRTSRFRLPGGFPVPTTSGVRKSGIAPAEYSTVDFETRLASYSDDEYSSPSGPDSSKKRHEKRESRDDAWVDILVSSQERRLGGHGPINMLLTTYFPAADGFNVKPQPHLRNLVASQGQHVSIDSYGGSVGTDPIPDFLVSIRSSKLDKDVPILIYEVKRSDEEETDAGIQMDRYIHWARNYQKNLVGAVTIIAVLVLGKESITCELDADARQVTFLGRAPTSGLDAQRVLQRVRDIWLGLATLTV